MKTTPILSVLLPAYNSERYIYDTIASVLNQSFKDFELLIFDDGSSDGTSEVIKGFDDNRIKLFSDGENRGYVNRLNSLLSKANGAFIARMDADDICHLKRFETQLDFLAKNENCHVVGTYSKTFYFYKHFGFTYKLPVSDSQVKGYLLFDSPMVHPAIMFRSEMIKEQKFYYNSNFAPAEDYELWMRLVKEGFVLLNIIKPLIHYRRHLGQTSSIRVGEAEMNSFKIRLNYFEFKYGKQLDDIQLTSFKTVWLEPEAAKLNDWVTFMCLYESLIKKNIFDVEGNRTIALKVFEMVMKSDNAQRQQLFNIYRKSDFNKYFPQNLSNYFQKGLRVFLNRTMKKVLFLLRK